MTFTPPPQALDSTAVADILRRYYARWTVQDFAFTGSQFDTWATAQRSIDEFTAEDLVAVTFLSVDVPPRAAEALLVSRKDHFAELLGEVGPDFDLHTRSEPFADDWAGWQLMRDLRDLPGVGPTTASKLFARKRPALRPIYDSVVEQFLGVDKQQWEPIRRALQPGDLLSSIQDGLKHADDDIPPHVTVVRALDVVCWMVGTKAA